MSQRPLAFLLALTLLAGCRTAPVGVSPSAATWTGPTGAVALSVSIVGTRRVQWVESYRATSFTAEVTGAGLSGWVPLTPVDNTTGAFGAMGPDGFRVASMAAKVPAGDRRVFRVKVYDTTPEPDLLLEELWGVGDVPANTTLQNTYPVTVKPMTTPTGQIFHRLLQLDEPKALTLPIDNVQHFVEELLNTNGITGDALRTGVPQVHPAVLDVDKATAAIVRGNSGIPFQIPAPIPDALLQRDPVDPLKRTLPDAMRQRGRVHARVLDVFGRTVSRPFVFYVTDTASPTRQAGANQVADVTWDEVAPGAWQLVATDLERAATTRKAVTVTAGALTDAFLVADPGLAPVAGAYNAEADVADSFNGENVPAAMAYLSNPGGFSVVDGTLTYVDAGNQRVRRFQADAAPQIVQTIAGTGITSHKGDGGPAKDAWLDCSTYSDAVVDKAGVTYIGQSDGTVRAIGTDGVIRNFWTPGYSGTPHLAYDAATNRLVVCHSGGGTAYTLNLDVYTGATPTLVYSAAQPGVNGIFKLPFSSGDNATDIAVSGGYVFMSTYYAYGAGSSLYRCPIAGGAVNRLMGVGGVGPGGDEVPVAQVKDPNIRALTGDGQGNLFFRCDAGLYRVTNVTSPTATASDWRAKLILTDPNLHAAAYDAKQDQLYLLTRKPFLNAAGATRLVPTIQRLVP